MNEETSLIAFRAICNFVNDLETVYGKNQKALKLYKRLINHTQIAHDAAIRKHLNLFQEFCVVNREAIMAKDSQKLTTTKITYSDRVYIDLGRIFQIIEDDTVDTIWEHILTISALVDPTGKAKEILKKSLDDGRNGKDEVDFLQNIISKVENNVNPNANPMDAVSSLLKSGMLNEMISDLGSKKLDMNKLLGLVQNMVSSMDIGDDPESKQAMGMLSMATNLLGGNGNSGGGAPNPADMMGLMSAMMSGMSGITPSEKKT